MSEPRKYEAIAWQAASVVFDREIGFLRPNYSVVLSRNEAKSYAVEVIMEFQKLLEQNLVGEDE